MSPVTKRRNKKISRALSIFQKEFDRAAQEVLGLYASGDFLSKGKKGQTEKHYGPGNHRTGTSQDVHGRPGDIHVGITSSRPGKPSRQVFQDMAMFERSLRSLSGVSDVLVRPGVGVWAGESEATWVVFYKGNGKALKYLAQVGKKYDQDAVLVMYKRGAGKGDPSQEYSVMFPATTRAMRSLVQDTFTAKGILGGTWVRSKGRVVYRVTTVPKYMSVAEFKKAFGASVAGLREAGVKFSLAGRKNRVLLIERDDYDKFIGQET